MDARVIRAFFHADTGRLWRVGDTFRGEDAAARQLAERGYLDLGGGAVAAPASDAADLASLTVSELRALCAERGIDVPKRARKAELVAALAEAGRG